MTGRFFILLLAGITLVDVLVPYLLIGHIPSLGASYLFWSVLTLAVILFAVIYVRNWGRPT